MFCLSCSEPWMTWMLYCFLPQSCKFQFRSVKSRKAYIQCCSKSISRRQSCASPSRVPVLRGHEQDMGSSMHGTHTMGSQYCWLAGAKGKAGHRDIWGCVSTETQMRPQVQQPLSQVIQPLPAGYLHRRHYPHAHDGLGSAKGEEMTQSSGRIKSDLSSPSAQVRLAPVLTSSAAVTSLTPI